MEFKALWLVASMSTFALALINYVAGGADMLL